MKALVLCGGYGTRLGPLCDSLPKPLLEVGDLTIVEHILRKLARHGIHDVFINLHYQSRKFRERLGDGSQLGVALQYLDEPVLLGTAGTPRRLSSRISDDLLVHYGDVLHNHDLTELVRRHRANQALATIVVHQRPGSNSAVLFDESGAVSEFLERPQALPTWAEQAPWAFSGIAVLARACVEGLPARAGSDLPRDVFPDLARRRKLFAERIVGHRCAVDSPTRLDAARRAWAEGRFV